MLTNIETIASQVEVLTAYIFTNKSLGAEALQMAAPKIAVLHNGAYGRLENNKRLSVMGDAVLTKILCNAWFNTFDARGNALTLAQWTELRNDTLANDSFARRGYNLDLDELIITNDGTSAVTAKMVATTLQAIIGAVYQDGGDDAAQRVLEYLGFFENHLLMIPLNFL